ncbi:MAG TPA: BspA family leucine-rich repeat surface protein [Saprospiraceae bacterium]|nr:BspA family leucine-rich repeat surface protein [Saprospiraceae bacterium]
MSGTIRFQFILTIIMFVTGLRGQSAFVTTWQTDMPGSSCNSCITIPTEGPGYSYNVDWDNDGSFDQSGITGEITHDFGAPGTYTIRIIGSFPRIYFNGMGDAQKLVSIDQWGSGLWTRMEKAFSGCLHMECNASDSPNLDFVGSTAWMFENCLLFNGDVTGWDVSQVNDMTGMFSGAGSFDQNLGNWLLKSNVLLLNFLDFSGISCENYDNTLMGWYNNPQTPPALTLGAAGVHYWLAIHARAYMLMPLCSGGMGWDIFGDSYQECDYFVPFVTRWNTANSGSSCQSCITIPTTGGGYSYDVDWNNDGIYDQIGVNGSTTYNFGSPGEYAIRIRGDFPRIFFNDQGDKEKLLSVDQWGSIEWSSMENAFMGCSNLEIRALDVPDLSIVSSMSGMFEACASMNQDLSEWNVSNVSDMSRLFAGATAFDQFVGSWDVSDVVNMEGMFAGASVFNQPLSSWNVSKVVNMSEMFSGTLSFNQQISAWNVSNVNNMKDMFSGAIAFDGNIGNWTLNQLVNLEGMLDGSGMSCLNYDNTLIGWLNKNSTPDNRVFGAEGVHYWLASPQRDQLITQKAWTINGDSMGTCDYVLPVCTTVNYPLDEAENVRVDAVFTWEPSGFARGYRLSIGTTPGGTDILDHMDVGNNTSYQPEVPLPCGAQLFTTIIPYNLKGNAGNCATVGFSTESVFASATPDQMMCSGSAIQLNAEGGTTFQWSPETGLSDSHVSNPLSAPDSSITYTVSVSNEGRCPVQLDVTVVVNTVPQSNIIPTNETGFQFNDGVLTVNLSGGQAPYSFYWDNGATQPSVSGLVPGLYHVTITDMNGCSVVDSAEVQAFICPELSIAAEVNEISCFAECDGQISISSVENAVYPLNYVWFEEAADSVKTNLCAGIYALTVTDQKNCRAEISFELIQPEEIQIMIDAQGNETGENNGFIEISSTGGGQQTYQWTGPNGYNSTDQDIYGLAAGCYQLVVTESGTNCTKEIDVCIEKLLSADGINTDSGIIVFPNPAKDLLMIDLGERFTDQAKVRIFSMDGRLVIGGKVVPEGKNYTMNIEMLENGLYILNIDSKGQNFIQKIQVNR